MGIGVPLCFSVTRAVYDIIAKRRSIPSAIFDVTLSSVFNDLADVTISSSLFDIDLSLTDDRKIQIPIREFAECTAQTVVDVGVDKWLSSHRLETLPSGLTIAKAAVVDVSGNVSNFQGTITQPSTQIIKPQQQIHLPIRRVVLSESILQPNQLPHRTLRGHII